MSSPKKVRKVSAPRSFGWMAEYADDQQLVDACRKVRDSGYTRTDAFAPFPVHGIDEALGIRPTVLPWIVLCLGLTGLSGALLMEWWMNAVAYPYIISDKPFFSLPAFIPVMFECTILFSAFTTFFSMIFLNGLPKFSNPAFTNPRFDRSTDDRFFLWVDSRDKYFNSDKVKSLLESTRPLSLDVVREDESSDHVPNALWRALVALILISLLPGAIILRMRASLSEDPRWHVFFDMDFQPKKRTQQTTTLFADNRVSRPPVAGTIARGDLTESDPYYLGYTPEDLALNAKPTERRMVSLQDAAASADAQAAANNQPPDNQPPDNQPANDQPANDQPANDQPANNQPADNQADNNPSSSEKPPAANQPPADDQSQASPAARDAAKQANENAPTSAPASDGNATERQGASPGEAELPWITEFPFRTADEKLMALGKLKYETNCAVCHGFAGNGDGLVSQRALQLAQGYWVQPTSLHEPRVQKQPVGKIFHTITNGRGKMGAYGPVLTAKERWAIVLYVRALQLSRDAKVEDVPEGQRAQLTATPASATPANPPQKDAAQKDAKPAK